MSKKFVVLRIMTIRWLWELGRDSRTLTSNVVVEWLALLVLVLEVPGSELGPETVCPDWRFRGFSQSLYANSGMEP
jgi:hypothetical protein